MKKWLVVGLCMMFLTVSSLAFADQVYITGQGKKYHKENCRTLKNKEVTAIEEEEAIKQGYEPCGVCLKSKDKQTESKEKAAPKTNEKKDAEK